MNEELRAGVARALIEAGVPGFKDTTTGVRPQWRASFSFRGELHGETSYIHVYVPVDADQLQVNSSALSPTLDPMPIERIQDELAEVNATYVPGSDAWIRAIEELGAAPADVEGWDATTRPYMGLRHRMTLARVTMPLASLSGSSVDLAIRLGLYLARVARDFLTASWEASQGDGEP